LSEGGLAVDDYTDSVTFSNSLPLLWNVHGYLIMKKILLISLFFVAFTTFAYAQMAFVDSKYILNKMPDYQDSVRKINRISAEWQKEIDGKQIILDKMVNDFERDQAMLTDEITKKRTGDIFIHEKEVRDLQRLRFGFEGDLFTKRQEMLKPVEDRVFNAARAVAVRMSYALVLDRSEGITVIYYKSNLDITGEVEKELGMN
jgi:outer membrane protein